MNKTAPNYKDKTMTKTTETPRVYKNLGGRDLRCATCKTWIKRRVGRYVKKFVMNLDPQANVRKLVKIHCESCGE